VSRTKGTTTQNVLNIIMNDNILNWSYNTAVAYTSPCGLSFEGPEYKLERRNKFTI
jgi:hypothetical protein